MFGFGKKKEEKIEETKKVNKCKMCGKKLEAGDNSTLCKRCKLGI
jgi:hypothetical protein